MPYEISTNSCFWPGKEYLKNRLLFNTMVLQLPVWESTREMEFPSHGVIQDSFVTYGFLVFWLSGKSGFEIWFKKSRGAFFPWEIQIHLHLNVLKRGLENTNKYKQPCFLPAYLVTSQHPHAGMGLSSEAVLTALSQGVGNCICPAPVPILRRFPLPLLQSSAELYGEQGTLDTVRKAATKL